jgi:hypothetical protein
MITHSASLSIVPLPVVGELRYTGSVLQFNRDEQLGWRRCVLSGILCAPPASGPSPAAESPSLLPHKSNEK